MPRRCTVCDHRNRKQVDEMLVSGGVSFRTIADRFGLSDAALKRHRADHLPALVAEAKQPGEVTNADDLVAQVPELQRRALAMLDGAEQAKDYRTALGVIRRRRDALVPPFAPCLARQECRASGTQEAKLFRS